MKPVSYVQIQFCEWGTKVATQTTEHPVDV